MSSFVLDVRRCRYGHPLFGENAKPSSGRKIPGCRLCELKRKRRHNSKLANGRRSAQSAALLDFQIKNMKVDKSTGAVHFPAQGKHGNGKHFLIDIENLELFLGRRWIVVQGYAVSNQHKKTVYAHHVVLPKHSEMFVDHINRNRLDNRKSNLRYLTMRENFNNSDFREKGICESKERFIRYYENILGLPPHKENSQTGYRCVQKSGKSYRGAFEFMHKRYWTPAVATPRQAYELYREKLQILIAEHLKIFEG